MKTVGKVIGEFRVDQDLRMSSNTSMYLSALNPGSDVDKFLVYGNSGVVGYRTGAEVLSDIGALGTSATAAAAALLTTTNQALDPTCFPTFAASATGNLAAYTNAALTFNSSSGALGASSLTTTGNITAVGTVHIDGTSESASRLEMSEDTDNGTNFIRIIAPANIGTTFSLTLPASDAAGAMVSNGSGTLSLKSLIEINRKFVLPGTTDGDYAAGDVVFFGGTTSMTAGKCYYLTDGGAWAFSNGGADATATGLLAIALGAASDTDGMLLRGMVTPYGPAGSDDEGKKVYLRVQDGTITTAIPTGSGQFVRIVGYMLHASNDAIYFCPDNSYVEVA